MRHVRDRVNGVMGMLLIQRRFTFWTVLFFVTLYVLVVWNVIIGRLPNIIDSYPTVGGQPQHLDPRDLPRAPSVIKVFKKPAILKSCEPKKHVLFVKVPKCGSSTLSSIILRYGYLHRLDTALPLNKEFNLMSLLRSLNSSGHQHDIFASHARYRVLREHQHLIPKDAFYMAIVREPLSSFKSFFNFRHKGEQFGLEGDHQLLDFFSNSSLYSSPDARKFWNRMIRYLGYRAPRGSTRSTPGAVRDVVQHVYRLEKEFDFVLVLELFEECLILLKRLLCWDTHDLFYIKQKSGSSYSADYKSVLRASVDPVIFDRHRELSYGDYILYDYFRNKAEKMIKNQDDDFFKEVNSFREINSKVTQFCTNQTNDDKLLRIPPTKWSNGFQMRKDYCRMLTFGPGFYSKLLEKGTLARFRKYEIQEKQNF